jgi:hypothetical protein
MDYRAHCFLSLPAPPRLTNFDWKEIMRPSSRCLLLGFLVLIFPLRMLAYSDWLPVTSEELKMTSVPQQPGASAVMLYHEEITDDFKHSQSNYTRIKILTEAGKKYADVEIPYERESHNVRFSDIASIKGRTIHPDGTISTFQGKPFDRILEKDNGKTLKVKSFAIPNVEVGSIIEYRFSRDYDSHWFLPPYWVLQDELFRVKQYFCFLPIAMRRGVAWSFVTPNNVAPVDNLQGKIELTLNNTPAFLDEPYMPPQNLFRYNVRFYYDLRRGNSDSFWRENGNEWNQAAEKFMANHGKFSEAVKSITSLSEPPEQRARKIYDFVQGFQNLDYSPHLSDDEKKALKLKEIHTAEDVLRQKRGDSEDLTRLFVALARAAQLDPGLMRVATRDELMFDEHYLDFDQLNHEIATLKLPSGELRLDPGVRYCPFGLLYWKHADTRGVRQGQGQGTELVTAEGNTYADAWMRRSASFLLEQDGQLKGTLEVIFHGQPALTRRIEKWDSNEAEKNKSLEDHVKEWFPSNAEITLANKPDWESTGDLVATFNVLTPAASSAGHRLLLPLDVIQFDKQAHFSHAERQWPIVFNHPYRVTDHFQIQLPDGLEIESVPPPAISKLAYAQYSMRLANTPKSIEIMRDLMVGASVFKKDRYPELKSFFDQVKAGDDLEAVLKGNAHDAKN